MTNLLPPAAKKQVILEYWIRIGTVWLITWSICLLISTILLWPTYILIFGSSEAYTNSVADASERTTEYQTISQELEQTTRQAQFITVAANQPVLSDIFNDIVNISGIEIDLSTVQINRDAKGLTPIQVTGTATNRQSLAQFRDNLELISYVEGVDLPIENLAKNQNIDFNIRIVVNNDRL